MSFYGVFLPVFLPIPVTSIAFSPQHQLFVRLDFPPLTELYSLCSLRGISTRWLVSLSQRFGLTPQGSPLSSEAWAESGNTTSKVWISAAQDSPHRPLDSIIRNSSLCPPPTIEVVAASFAWLFCYTKIPLILYLFGPFCFFSSSVSRILNSTFSLIN